MTDVQESSDKLSFYLFADDTNILFANKNLKSFKFDVNHKLNKVYDWLIATNWPGILKKVISLYFALPKGNFLINPKSWYQNQNQNQTKIVIFDNKQNKKVAPEHKDYVKYLRILIDKNLSWKHHIDHIIIKVSWTVGLIAKLRHFLPTHILLNIYIPTHTLLNKYIPSSYSPLLNIRSDIMGPGL